MTTLKLDEITSKFDLAELAGPDGWDVLMEIDFETRVIDFFGEAPHERNTTSGREWHGHCRSYRVPVVGALDFRRAVEACLPTLHAVCDTYRSEWDGSNHVGRLDPDLAEALDREITLAIDGLHHSSPAGYWDAGEWLTGLGGYPTIATEVGLTAESTDTDLVRIATEIVSDARNEDALIDQDDCEDFLKIVRDEITEETE